MQLYKGLGCVTWGTLDELQDKLKSQERALMGAEVQFDAYLRSIGLLEDETKPAVIEQDELNGTVEEVQGYWLSM